MKKFFLWTVVSTFVFVLTLELVSWTVLTLGYQHSFSFPPGLIQTQEELTREALLSSRRGEVSRLFNKWLSSHPELKTNLVFDRNLRSEGANYVNIGVNTQARFFTSLDRLAPLIDDDFEVFGKISGKLKYRVRYKTTLGGGRVTGFEEVKDARANVIFVGCSFTFGEGLNTEQTFPAVVGQSLKNVRVYNYGVPGSSPSVRLSVMHSNPEMFTEIDRTLPTVVVFVFIDDHVRRVIGTSELYARDSWQYWNLPAYVLENGSLQFQKSYAEDFWNLRWLVLAYSKTHFSRATRLELPIVGPSHFELISAIMAEMRDEFSRKFPRFRKFYVANFIGEHYYFRSLIPFLEKKGLGIIDYSGINYHNFLGEYFFVPNDFHPSSLTNNLFATLLEHDLKRILGEI